MYPQEIPAAARRSAGTRLAALALTLALPFCALAGAYPERPVRMIVPFAAGGPTDVVARMLADKMSAALGQPIVVENRGGAGGMLGTRATAEAAADGYTIGMATASTHAFSAACNEDAPYDPVQDFAMVGIISTTPSIVFVKQDSPYRRLDEILQASRQDPDQVTWGTPGVCSNTHFLIELVNKAAGSRIVAVPYRGNSAVNNDLLGGVLTLASDAVTPATVGLIETGRIRPLALTEPSDLPLLDGVPTYGELGVNIGSFVVWQGLVAPAGTPDDRIDVLNRALRTALADPDLRQRWSAAGITPFPDNSPQRMLSYVRDGYDTSRRLVAELGIAAN